MLSTYLQRISSVFGKAFAFLLAPELYFLGHSQHEELLLHYHLLPGQFASSID